MRRREFISLVGASAVTWPLAAGAQQAALPVIGVLSPQSSGPAMATRIAAFHKGLSELHYVAGENVAIEYRWADGQYDRLRTLADDLVHRSVAVLVAPTHDAALAAKAATDQIPIVFNVGGDPVSSGLVASMNRPGGNATGFSMFTSELAAKRLGLLHELIPKVATVGVVIKENANTESQSRELQDAARSLGLQLSFRSVSNESDLDPAVAGLVKAGAQAMTTEADPFLAGQRGRLVALAAKYGLPAMWEWADFVEGGGLMSYGTSILEAYRQVGVYTGRILKGEPPAELPVMQPVKFDLTINLKTAKVLGIEVPATLLARADDVIE